MTLRERLSEYIRACFTGIWIESHEHDDALKEIAHLCRDENWMLATWNVATGLASNVIADPEHDSTDPLAAIRSVCAMASQEGTVLLVSQNFHRFMQSAEIVQEMARQIVDGKQHRTIVVVLGSVYKLLFWRNQFDATMLVSLESLGGQGWRVIELQTSNGT